MRSSHKLAAAAAMALMAGAVSYPVTVAQTDGARASTTRASPAQPVVPNQAPSGGQVAVLDWHMKRFTDRFGYPKNAGWADRRYRRAAAKLRRQAKARRASR